ncbi:hypothetical protein LXA43DRAFT_1118910 [Ganoderma leucocontextum]|nr:hypothetical protein LXA43DRAFT_1118910 [Ganoderma leucocontextum]
MGQQENYQLRADSHEIPNLPWMSGDDHDRGPSNLTEYWEASRLWLSKRGVELYELLSERPDYPWKDWSTPPTSTAARLPYARCIWGKTSPPRAFVTTTRLACAQDPLGRDLMLKLVSKASSQYDIFQLLSQRGELFSDSKTFPCVIPPLTILDTPHAYSIVTMPTWGSPFDLEELQTVGEVLRFMECTLQGLVFLHENRIAHRDICEHNMAVNCYRLDQDYERLSEDLFDHRKRSDVFYALMDYDQSIHLPEVSSVKHCRRPANEAWVGSAVYKPDDVCLGEPGYNPFAFDVGMLGNMFRVYFSMAVPSVPTLPALFDKMTTHVVSQRFSAEEALEFFRRETKDLPRNALEAHLILSVEGEAMYYSDVYWSRLSPQLQAQWASLRTPPLGCWFHILNRLMQIPICCRVIVSVRRLLGI